MCRPRLEVDGQHGKATWEVKDGYVGRTSGTMRRVVKEMRAGFAGRCARAMVPVTGDRGMVEQCPRTMGRRLGTLVKGRVIGGDVVFMDDK